MKTGDKTATTHAVLGPSEEPKEPPLIVLPAEEGEWDLIGTTCCVTPEGSIHFFWFWADMWQDREFDAS